MTYTPPPFGAGGAPGGYPPPSGPPGAPQPYPQYAAGGPGYAPAPKTDGFAIASLVLSLLCGGFILGVIFGFVSLSRIKKSQGALTGRGLAIAGIVIGIVGTLAIAGLIAIAVIFGAEQKNVDDYATGDDHEIAVLFDRFEQALEDGDADEACNDIFTEEFRALLDSGPESCRDIVTKDADKLQAEIDIQTITVDGTQATVVVDEAGERLTFELTKTDSTGEPSESGEWHISGGMR